MALKADDTNSWRRGLLMAISHNDWMKALCIETVCLWISVAMREDRNGKGGNSMALMPRLRVFWKHLGGHCIPHYADPAGYLLTHFLLSPSSIHPLSVGVTVKDKTIHYGCSPNSLKAKSLCSHMKSFWELQTKTVVRKESWKIEKGNRIVDYSYIPFHYHEKFIQSPSV